MTEIVFHVNVGDKLNFGCRLLRKAYLSGARVAVTAEPELLQELDRQLWLLSPTDFVPHTLVAGASPEEQALSPILLTESLMACPEDAILLNLGQGVPSQFERFERCIEVVSQDPDAVLAGRERWRHYAARGYALKVHQRAEKASAP